LLASASGAEKLLDALFRINTARLLGFQASPKQVRIGALRVVIEETKRAFLLVTRALAESLAIDAHRSAIRCRGTVGKRPSCPPKASQPAPQSSARRGDARRATRLGTCGL
jgi:hypothetical protein